MPNLFSSIAHAFEEGPQKATTLNDVSLLDRRLGLGFAALSASNPAASSAEQLAVPLSSGTLPMQPGLVFVHPKRSEASLPSVSPLPLSGISAIDAHFRRRSEQLLQEMNHEFSDFSLAGLSWAEQRAREDADLAAERAAEDSAIARRRFEEDAALAARRARQDDERASHASLQAGSYYGERETQEAALASKWQGKFAELTAALEEAVAADEAQKALDEQRKKEEEARLSEQVRDSPCQTLVPLS